jgi:NAD(P)-dependent dehydrogenase (short-subunit alcohol dehydrogenase family)
VTKDANLRLQDKVVFVTGAGAGLGRESAALFAEEGARLVVTDVDRDRVHETAASIEAHGGEVLALTVDVADESSVRDGVAAAVGRFGGLDVMFANAGIQVPGYPNVAFEDWPIESWQRVMDVNLTGAFLCCKHSVAPMRARGGGSIVLTSSAVALAAARDLAPYAATKGGINALVRAAAVDLGRYGIRVNAICPLNGMSPNFLMPADAAVIGASSEEARGAWDPEVAHQPLKLPVPPTLRDNAMAALFFASGESAYTTGVCLPVTDGGILAGVYLHL